ncbi:class I SAM-dependent methyltransferase [uncultured Caulobacter sp.]|uniref:class I SAM-dependent methyltransferase n=1 Tax=uncultured Caulobacter sp. TaxID=158749 RepID=UPI0026332712|nr:class I SAM-dependent methyltransferase [uncultured Caulobacter sp.]
MNEDWSAGYVVETGYTYGAYPELNPVRAALPLLLKGLRAPRIETACELGFGQGCSAAVHAATQADVEWWGCDFAPAQAVFARDLVAASGARAHFFDDAFDEFAERPGLPDFDYVALHGVWSWVNDEARAKIVSFLRRRLKPGGLVYISYNAQPGWALAGPLRHLMKRHAETLGAPGLGPAANLEAALSTMQRFFAEDPVYSRINPGVTDRLEAVMRQDRAYLVHEYMNRDWHPMWFADVEARLSAAKLAFAASAYMSDHVDALNLSPGMIGFLQGLPDPSLRETFRDFAVQAQFRRDYWLRGASSLAPADQGRLLRDQRVVLVRPASQRPSHARGTFAEMALSGPVIDAIYDQLADGAPRTLGELEAGLPPGADFSALTASLVMLISQNAVQPAQAAPAAARASETARALNLELARRAAKASDLGFLAAPVTGGAINATRFHQLFWLAMRDGGGPAEWARFAAEVLARQGQALVADGVALAPEAGLAALEAQASAFADTVLPCWRGLGIA